MKRVGVIGLTLVCILGIFPGSPADSSIAKHDVIIPEFTEGSWTLAVLPDTQYYSLHYPDNFTAQTGWVCENADELNIQYVLQLGDVTHLNSRDEWVNARAAFELLDGCVPYAIATGNHDNGPGGNPTVRQCGLNDYFDYEEIAAWETFGGSKDPDDLENTYHLFEVNCGKWIVIATEWAPCDETLKWANDVMSEHEDRMGIFITHAYMQTNDVRMDHMRLENPESSGIYSYATPRPINDGEEIWDRLVRKHDFRIVLSGHVCGDGTGYLASENDHGHTCHQILTNFQMRDDGGQGFLRLMHFLPDGVTVQSVTYSPIVDKYLTAADQQFVFDLD